MSNILPSFGRVIDIGWQNTILQEVKLDMKVRFADESFQNNYSTVSTKNYPSVTFSLLLIKEKLLEDILQICIKKYIYISKFKNHSNLLKNFYSSNKINFTNINFPDFIPLYICNLT